MNWRSKMGPFWILSGVLVCVASCEHSEICDWEDNDRDGIIDEGFDADGDGVWACGINETAFMLGDYDCDDDDPEVGPDQEEICGGGDENCDGVLDEGCPSPFIEVGGKVLDVEWIANPENGAHWLLVYSNQQSGDGPAFSLYEMSESGAALSFRQIIPSYWGIYDLEIYDWGPDDRYPTLLAVNPDGVFFLIHNETDYELGSYLLLDEFYTLGPAKIYLLENNDDGGRFLLSTQDGSSEGGNLFEIVVNGDILQLSEVQSTVTSDPTTASRLVDLDDDGDMDLIEAHRRELLIYKQDAEGRFVLMSTQVFEEDIGDIETSRTEDGQTTQVLVSIPERFRLYVSTLDNELQIGLWSVIDTLRHPNNLFNLSTDGGEPTLWVGDLEDSRSSIMVRGIDGEFTTLCKFETAGAASRLTRPSFSGHLTDSLSYSETTGIFYKAQMDCGASREDIE